MSRSQGYEMKTIFLTEWRERLNHGDISQYRSLANDWLTCATGERVFKEFGRRSKNYVDSLSGEARQIGNEFTDAVKDCDVKKAQEALEKIEGFDSIWEGDVKPEPSPICDTCGHDSTPVVKPKKKAKAKRKPRA